MTDLEINIALAKAMGWDDVDISASFYGQALETYDQHKGYWRRFDYRDPVIFVAICKHWKLAVFHKYLHCYCAPTLLDFNVDTIEKAAALCVIAAVKRGVK
jgi:hypothetical protein